jgi:AraC-like DNA-binding protein
MNWIRDISIVILVVSVAGIVFSLIGRSYFAKHEMSLLIPSLLFSTIYFEIGFRGNQQLPIIETLAEEDENLKIASATTENNGLTSQLIQLFEKEKIYRQPDLRITNVSALLDTNRTYISRLINDEFEMNFNEFVNKYRIEETKRLLRNKSHNSYTMEYIAEQAGFGSVASFSRVFKEMLGTTPSKYRDKHKS